MHRTYTLTVLLLSLLLDYGSSTAAGPDESKEPPLEFVVKVGEKTISIIEGKTIQLDGVFTNPQIAVKPQPYRVFPYQGITFKYPRSFAFEADLANPSGKNWTLSGNDLKIMYFVLNSQITTSNYADSMIDQFGRGNCNVTDANAKITLGKQTLSGTTFQVTVVNHKMLMNIYRIPSRGAVTKLIVFQDSLDDAGNRSTEGKQALKEIMSSFTVEQ